MRTQRSLVEQHASEASFLWCLRDLAVGEPQFDLATLAALDERVEAHVDGLRLAGDLGWEVCVAALGLAEPGEVFAAAVVAADAGDVGRVAQVLDVAGGARPLRRAVVSA